MSISRLMSLLALVALLVAPFGRMAAAEAMPRHSVMTAPIAHGSVMVPGHCDDRSTDQGKAAPASIDCMTACLTLAPASGPSVEPGEPARLAPLAQPLQGFAGIDLTADPPPPRFS